MNKAEENQLSELARKARNLRECIDAADLMLQSWAQHKAEAGEIYVALGDRRHDWWNTRVSLPVEVVQADFVPMLRRIRDEAATQLRHLALEFDS